MSENTQQLDLSIEQNLENSLKQFSPIEAAVEEMKKFYDLKLTSLEDVKTYKEIVEARKFVKGKRIEVRKKKEELNENALAWQRKVNAEEKRITALLEPIESYLESEEAKFENWKKEDREKKEREEMERVNTRTAILIDLQMQFTGHGFVMEELMITQDEICDFSEDEFTAFTEKVKPVSARVAEAKAEQERKDKEERDRLEKQRLEQAEQQRKIDEENKRIEDEKAALQKSKDDAEKAILEGRIATIQGMGATRGNISLDHAAWSISSASLKSASGEEFEEIVKNLREKTDQWNKDQEVQRKKYEEEKAKKARTKDRMNQLEAIGIPCSGVDVFEIEFDNSIGGEEGMQKTRVEYIIEIETIHEMPEDKWQEELIKARETHTQITGLRNKEKEIRDARIEREKQAREESLRPDKEKLQSFADSLRKFTESAPQVENNIAKTIVSGIKVRIMELSREIEESIQKF